MTSPYQDGGDAAKKELGVPPETPAWKKYLPTALGVAGAAGAGFGTYKALTRTRFSGNKVLDGLRRRSAAKGFHPLVDVSRVTPDTTDKSDPLHLKALHALNEWRQPRVNEKGHLDMLNRFKMRVMHGPDAIAAGSSPGGKTFRIDSKGAPTQEPLKVRGVVSDRNIDAAHGGALGAHIIGGRDLEGDSRTKAMVSSLGSGGKRVEADLLQKHAPDALPRTELDLSKLHPENYAALSAAPGGRAQIARAMQQNARKNFGKQFMLKPAVGLQSGGEFPTHKGDWGKHLSKYDAHFSRPENATKFEALGDVDRAWYLKDRGLYEGHTLNEMLKDPKAAILQEMIPNYSNEYRVHSIAGSPTAAHSRWFSGGGTRVPDKELHEFVQGITSKLPPEYQKGHYGFDVGVGMDPATKKRILKVIEMNPYEQRGAGNSGGGSGFLDPHVIPGAGRELYRHATGKQDPLRAGSAALGAAGAVGAGGVLAGHLLRGRDPTDGSQDPSDPSEKETT